MKYASIPYEALDSTGRPVMREAQISGELPHETRLTACADAAKGIGQSLGLTPIRAIPFGAPVYEAFGLTRPEAKAHSQSNLLMTLGHDVALSRCG